MNPSSAAPTPKDAIDKLILLDGPRNDDGTWFEEKKSIIEILKRIEASPPAAERTALKDTLEDWLTDCRKVTVGHIRRRPTSEAWPLADQINHVHSEVSEVYQAIRKGEGRLRVEEEMADIIYSGITLFHIAGFTDAEIMEALGSVMWKIAKKADVHSEIKTFKLRDAASASEGTKSE